MSEAAEFPTADQVATAIVTAARLLGEDPLDVAGGGRSRARNVAMEALVSAFPDARRVGLGRCCGFAKPDQATTHLSMARKAGWWREDLVDEVVGAVVAERYGEQGR